ncbi:hypothetical protein [Clostridiisalibacter paucivorans]|uniref:hypothetical protein n=1 Tax=Clostridiisalibacter paucivorans TaxID=408753 RepID=UPI0005519494|nr:hypothetical protein [Clostridiisalibacter paucivorans]
MKVPDFITEFQGYLANSFAKNVREEDTRDLNQVTELFNNLTEVAIRIMQDDPEFRKNFGRIHSEFLKYPEGQQLVNEIMTKGNENNNLTN